MPSLHCWIVIVTASLWQVPLICALLAPLFPVVSKVDWHHNGKYINVSIYEPIKDAEEQDKGYLIEMISMRELKEMRVYVAYSVRSFNGAIQNKLFSRSIDICQFIRRPNMDRLLNMFYENIKRNSTIPTRCPVATGVRTTVNFVTSSLPVPGFIPETDFLVDVNMFTGLRQEPIFESRWYGRLQKVISQKKAD